MSKAGIVLGFVVASALMPAPAAEACLCGGLANPCASLWAFEGETPIVFEGTVEAIEPRFVDVPYGAGADVRTLQRQMLAVRFTDVRHRLGEAEPVVVTGVGGGDCGYEKFRVGQRFVVHARREAEGLTTSTCSFTAPVDQAREVLDYLDGLARPSPGARIIGKVVMARREHVGLPSTTSTPLAGVAVTLEGPRPGTAVTDERGQYEFKELPPGRYEVALSTPREDLLRVVPRNRVVLANAHACATPYAEFYVNGTVEGLVVDPDGQPVAKARLSLRAQDIEGKDEVAYDSSITDESGRYRFQTLGAGRYVVGFNMERGPTAESPYAMGVGTNAAGAPAIVDLAHGGHAVLDPIVARRPAPVVIGGRLTLPGGEPAGGVRLRIFTAGELRRFGDTTEVVTDVAGRFTARLDHGQRYAISVFLDSGMRVEHDFVAGDRLNLELTLQPRR